VNHWRPSYVKRPTFTPSIATRSAASLTGPRVLLVGLSLRLCLSDGELVLISRTRPNASRLTKLCCRYALCGRASSVPTGRRIRKSGKSNLRRRPRVHIRFNWPPAAQIALKIPPRARTLWNLFHVARLQFLCPRTGCDPTTSGCADTSMAQPGPLRGW